MDFSCYWASLLISSAILVGKNETKIFRGFFFEIFLSLLLSHIFSHVFFFSTQQKECIFLDDFNHDCDDGDGKKSWNFYSIWIMFVWVKWRREKNLYFFLHLEILRNGWVRSLVGKVWVFFNKKWEKI